MGHARRTRNATPTRQHPWVDSYVPGINAARNYRRGDLRPDLVAGLTLFTLLIPAGMAYAELAGLPPVTGLYATILPLLAYALFGPSKVLVLGPDSSLGPMIAAAILPLALGNTDRAVALAGLLAIIVGLLMVLGRFLNLGFVTDLLSKPIRLGYLNGIALVVFAGQLPKLLGISVPGETIWAELTGSAAALISGAFNPVALLMGLGCLVLIKLPSWLHLRIPGTMLAVVAAVAVTFIFGLTDKLPMVGALPPGLPAPALSGLAWPDVAALAGPAAGIALIAFADTGVLSRTIAARRGESVSGNAELGALGVANVASGLFGGFPVSSSTSRTPVAIQAGSRTQLTGVVAATLLVAFMLLAPGVTAYLPVTTLAAVIIVAAGSMVDIAGLRLMWRASRTETVLMFSAFLGVAVVGVLQGILVAIALSLLAFVQRAWNPYRTELVRVPGMPGYHDVDRHPDGTRISGLIIARFDAPLFFANGAVFAAHIRELVDQAPGPVHRVVVAAEAITGIDTTALDDLVELDKYLEQHGIDLVFAEMKGPVKDRLARLSVGARFGPENFFPTIESALRSVGGNGSGTG
ncbi:SulP family inorganic anion transporter [Arthrobacter sp. I2-34]|uniref:SulP family inorganic anion transporter n=1 Tax=Arthrobacter hankyongi TaxID=2904801 RepID=A0ABS9LCH5_9MICC|nr:SulP family inorganic anion transporter [Arthrobacter hankyongi]MCG2624380.1 SulP family inorganic anion transporter [Arthrobacter hankyongi]